MVKWRAAALPALSGHSRGATLEATLGAQYGAARCASPENLKREQARSRAGSGERGRLGETGRDPAADCLQGGNIHGAAACLVKCKPTCGATAAANGGTDRRHRQRVQRGNVRAFVACTRARTGPTPALKFQVPPAVADPLPITCNKQTTTATAAAAAAATTCNGFPRRATPFALAKKNEIS